MNAQGYLLVYGSLILIIAMIVCGVLFLPVVWAKLSLTIGIIFGIVYIIVLFQLLQAMNSDI